MHLGTCPAGSDDISLRHAVGIDMAAVHAMKRSQKLRGVDQRVELGGFLGRDQLHLEAKVLAPARHHADVVEHRLVGGQHHIAGRMDAAGLARDLLDLAIEVDRVLLQLRDVGVGVIGVDAGRSMPSRAGCQLVLLEQDDVLPADLRQVVEHARADHSPADDDCLCMRFHVMLIPSVVWRACFTQDPSSRKAH